MVAQFGLFDIAGHQKVADVPGAYAKGAQMVQGIRANNTAESLNQQKITEAKLTNLHSIAQTVQSPADVQRALKMTASFAPEIANEFANLPPEQQFQAIQGFAKSPLEDQLKAFDLQYKMQQMGYGQQNQAMKVEDQQMQREKFNADKASQGFNFGDEPNPTQPIPQTPGQPQVMNGDGEGYGPLGGYENDDMRSAEPTGNTQYDNPDGQGGGEPLAPGDNEPAVYDPTRYRIAKSNKDGTPLIKGGMATALDMETGKVTTVRIPGDKEMSTRSEKKFGQKAMFNTVNKLVDNYKAQNAAGAAVDENGNIIGNNLTALSGWDPKIPFGGGDLPGPKTLMRGSGSKNQGLRDTGEGLVISLLQDIKQASGAGAKQFDSDTDVKMMLSQAGQPGISIQSKLRLLDNIAGKYLAEGQWPGIESIPGVKEIMSGEKKTSKATGGAKFLGYEGE